jgi:TRAP-type C4-dicarboxylate transport system permease large subunit
MVLLILMAAAVFSQILAYSQATKDMIQVVLSFPLPPIMVIMAMQALAIAMGTVMSTVAILMITLPIFMPIVVALGFDPLWFSVLLLLNMEMGAVSPPFGLTLFVMKGVSSADTTIGDIYRAVIPYLVCDLLVMVSILIFPAVTLYLPSIMR